MEMEIERSARGRSHLGDEHDADGDAGHDVGLEPLAPPVGAEPPGAGEEELEPLAGAHAAELRRPPGV